MLAGVRLRAVAISTCTVETCSGCLEQECSLVPDRMTQPAERTASYPGLSELPCPLSLLLANIEAQEFPFLKRMKQRFPISRMTHQGDDVSRGPRG